MANERKVSLSTKRDEKPSKSETRAEAVSERPSRIKLDGYRNILSVDGRDPAFEYRFIKDVSLERAQSEGLVDWKPGQRISRFQAAGWQLVKSSEVKVGENTVYKTENLGSVVRVPAGNDEFLFLMKIHKDWYDEDQQAKLRAILDTEKQYSGETQEEGMYGSVSID